MLAYCFFRTPLSPIDFTVRLSARTSIWLDALRMPAATQAMLVAAVKSTDFLLGFVVGKWSDSTRSPLGRRRPFIAVAFPVGLGFFLAFCNAGYLLGAGAPQPPLACASLVGNRTTGDTATHCPALRACLDAAIRSGELPPPAGPLATSTIGAAPPDKPGLLRASFVILYFGFVFCCWTCTQIPYDALGMELTDDYAERARLFGAKAAFQFVGYLASPLAGIVLSALTTDLLLITSLRAALFTVLGLVAQVLLLRHVTERPPRPRPTAAAAARVPLIPSARRALSNAPYIRYLQLKVPLSIFSFVPSSMVSFYIKYSLALEAWSMTESIVLVLALIGGMLCSACSVATSHAARRASRLHHTPTPRSKRCHLCLTHSQFHSLCGWPGKLVRDVRLLSCCSSSPLS
jgi:hypothetical protein